MATIVRMNAARSASACARERDVCACSTSRMMLASAVRSPVPVTSTRSEPAPLTVPAITFAPSCFWNGHRLAGDHRLVDVALTARGRCRRQERSRQAARAPDRRPAARRSARPRSARRRSAAPCSGSSFASSRSAPCAWEIDRISIQWPSSMMRHERRQLPPELHRPG